MSNVQPPSNGRAALAEAWGRLYAKRLDWAEDVREEFIEQLESDVVRSAVMDARAADRREVVVIGKSQVGKTTLILRLYGVVDEAARNRLDRVLRGGRKQGNSATATATTFAISPDSRFRIQRPFDDRPVALSDDEALERMASVRESVEQGKLGVEDMMRVELPGDAIQEGTVQPNLEVVDLPGLDGTDDSERQHAKALARAHIHRAHLVLLVTKAEQLAEFLSELRSKDDRRSKDNRRSKGFPLPSSWMHWKERFSIVLTHALSPESEKQRFRDSDSRPGTQADYVQRYRDSLLRECRMSNEYSDSETDAVGTLPLYPIEMGPLDWAGAEGARQIRNWMTRQIDTLRDRIDATNSPGAQIRFLVSTFHVAEKKAELEEEAFEKRIATLKKDKEEEEHLLKATERKIRELERERERLKDEKSELPSVKELFEGLPKSVRSCPSYNRGSTCRESLFAYMDTEKSRMLSLADQTVDLLKEDWRDRKRKEKIKGDRFPDSASPNVLDDPEEKARSLRSDIGSIIGGCYSNVKAQLNQHWTRLIFKNKKWESKCINSVKKSNKKVKKKIKTFMNKYIKFMNCFYRKIINKLSKDVRSKKQIAKERKKSVRSISEDIFEENGRFDAKKGRMEQDIQRWRRLSRMLKERAGQEVKKQTESICESGVDFEGFLQYFYALQVQKEVKSLTQ